MSSSTRISLCAGLAAAAVGLAPTPTPASANPLKTACGIAGWINRTAERACTVIRSPGKVVGTGKKILTGQPAQGFKTLLGSGSPGSKATAALTLAAVGAWVLGGARFVLTETAKLLGSTTSPQLGSTWFSSAYWRVAGIAALLTLPFLFAAAIQALVRSDLALLTRATFGYLPLSLLAVGIAAPLTMLLLAASDEMSAIVSAASGHAAASFTAKAGAVIGLGSVAIRAPFVAFMVGLLTVAGALVLWLELLVRAAAVYVVVLMLPLAFAAMVWPARRIWAVRAVEMLVALILAKFAIVAVLGLGGAALNHLSSGGIAAGLAGAVLVILGAFAPWALLRLLPLAELGHGAVGALRPQLMETVSGGLKHEGPARAWSERATDWATGVIASMRHDADGVDSSRLPDGPRGPDGQDGTAAAEAAGAARAAGRESLERNLAADPNGAGTGAPSLAGDGLDEALTAEPGAEPGANGSPGRSHRPGERLPGMDPIWQAPDWSWEPLVLGLEEPPSEPEPLSQPEPPSSPEPSSDPEPSSNQQAYHERPRARRRDPTSPAPPTPPTPPAEDHDPLPDAQEPGDGRL